LDKEQVERLTGWLKETLGARVADVKASERLVGSPALALNADKFMSPHMRRMMKAMHKGAPESPLRVNLEINPRHAVVRHLAELQTSAPEKAALVAQQILDNALISAGLLEDTSQMVQRLYKLLETA
jgi:molecular chaperone HtpG